MLMMSIISLESRLSHAAGHNFNGLKREKIENPVAWNTYLRIRVGPGVLTDDVLANRASSLHAMLRLVSATAGRKLLLNVASLGSNPVEHKLQKEHTWIKPNTHLVPTVGLQGDYFAQKITGNNVKKLSTPV